MLGLRLRFAGALVVLVLPLLAGAWVFGNYAAENKRDQTDTQLNASLRAAASEYARVVDDAQLHAMKLATSRHVQRALETRNQPELQRLRKAHPDVLLLTGRRAGAPPPGVALRSVDVVSGNRVVGSVVARVALDRAVLTRIANNAGLVDQGEIAVAERGGRVVAASAPVAGAMAVTGPTRERSRSAAAPSVPWRLRLHPGRGSASSRPATQWTSPPG